MTGFWVTQPIAFSVFVVYGSFFEHIFQGECPNYE